MVQDDVLFLLEKYKGDLITGGDLAKELNVSRNAIWKAIRVLQQEGHDITSQPNKGYILAKDSDGLSEKMISSLLKTEFLGRNITILKTTKSTNNYLKSLSHSEMKDGMVVIADEQTGGRGRLDRSFTSLDKEGIYMSLLVKPQIYPDKIQLLTLCAAVSVARAVEEVGHIKPGIKWVNDILLNGKKLCGILSEASLSAEMQYVDYAVVGIGINTGVIEEELKEIATSILIEADIKGIRNELIAAVLNEFESLYQSFLKDQSELILSEYQERLCIIGDTVEVYGPQVSFDMIVSGIDDTGALLGVDLNGQKQRITVGEVKVKRRI